MTGERQLTTGREDPDCALGWVINENRLRVPELQGDRLASVRRDRRAVEEHAERIAAPAVGPDEDAQDVELGHG